MSVECRTLRIVEFEVEDEVGWKFKSIQYSLDSL